MQTNDLPLAQQLAALLEAGRACNPDKAHIREELATKDGMCAMGFIAAALGLDVSHNSTSGAADDIAQKLGVGYEAVYPLVRRIVQMNDSRGASLAEIAEAIRTNTLPEVSPLTFMGGAVDLSKFLVIDSKPFVGSFLGGGTKSIDGMWVDEATSWMKVYPIVHSDGANITFSQVGEFKPTPAKAVRQSAKTGATWPAPKHAYA
jgi:hypothetical protein